MVDLNDDSASLWAGVPTDKFLPLFKGHFMARLPLVILLITCFGLAACDRAQTDDEAPTEGQHETDVASDDQPTEESAEELDDLDEDTRQAALTDPSLVTDQAPETFQVRFETTQGDFTVEVHRDWAPHGADRLFNLVRIGYFEDIAFFRVIDGFMAQFGIHDSPEVNRAWRSAEIPDDEAQRSNTRGKLTFATRGPNTRTSQLFINYADNSQLDAQGFTPVGEVVDGMDVVDSLYSGYGEGAPGGAGPDQGRIQQEGNSYLRDEFPDLDYLERASIEHP